jgi:hypothetical protein
MTLQTESASTPADEPVQYVAIRHEFVDIEMLGMDPEQPVATELMSFCAAILALIAVRPGECLLVVTGDFVESVKQRLPEGVYRDRYDIVRGSGLVGGKTILVGDQVHVVMPAQLFVPDTATMEDPGNPGTTISCVDAFSLDNETVRGNLARRTVIHEAQHVAMMQAGEGDDRYEDEQWVRRNLLTLADQVISEYRAERGVLEEFREGDDERSALASLQSLRQDFHRIAAVEYQQHLDVGRLQYSIVQESHTAWKVLAYFAAARRVAGISVGEPVSEELAETAEWSMMAAPHWGQFEELLADLPPGVNRVDLADLERVTTELADLFAVWLRSFGFTWRDIGENSEFRIVSWDFVL